MSKKPFTIRFKDRSVIIHKDDYQKEKGLLRKSYDRTVAYLKKFCTPTQVKEYQDHCQEFTKIFNNIEKNIK